MDLIKPAAAAFKLERVALAAVLACASLAAHAQSSVTLYGIIDTFVEAADNGDDTIARVESGGAYGTRWGMRGREDLGGGLAAIFGLEAGFNNDTGVQGQGGLAFGRLAQVGLVHKDYGQVSLGRQYTPMHNIIVGYTQQAAGLGWGNAASAYVYTPQTSIRNDNSALYVSPVWAGFTFKAMASAGEGTTGRAWSTSLLYALGAFSVSGAYYEADAPRGTPVGSDGDDKIKLAALAGAYDFKVAKLTLLYQQARNDDAAFDVDQQFWDLGVTFPIGAAGSLMVDYGQLTNDALDDADSQNLSVKYEHALSKRTSLYTGYSKVRNDALAAYRINGAGNQGVALSAVGSDPSSFVVGMYHRF